MSVPVGNVDVVSKTTTSHTDTLTASATETDTGASTDVYDGSFTTYHGVQSAHGGDGSNTCTITSEHTWIVPRDLSPIIVKLYAYGFPHGNYVQSIVTAEIWVQQSGTWNSIYTYTGTGEVTLSPSLTTGWVGVTGIKVYVYAYAYSYEGTRSQDCYTRVYEVQGFYRKTKSYAGIV